MDQLVFTGNLEWIFEMQDCQEGFGREQLQHGLGVFSVGSC